MKLGQMTRTRTLSKAGTNRTVFIQDSMTQTLHLQQSYVSCHKKDKEETKHK